MYCLKLLKNLLFFFVFVACINGTNNIISPAHAQTGFFTKLADSALSIINPNIQYNPKYFSIDYPNGDIPKGFGVCSDVIIRAYRKVGIDLQKAIHEDMLNNFSNYPQNWGLSGPDKNIDHRRVPNLMTFFFRHGKTLPITNNPKFYNPGDIVCWNLGNGILHIGLVVNKKNSGSQRYLVLHNIGNGQVLSDCLFSYTIIGHYRYKN